MKIFAVKDNEVSFNLSSNSPTEFFNTTTSLPLCFECFDDSRAAERELQEVREIFRNSNAGDHIELKILKAEVSGGGNAATPRSLRRRLRIESSFLNELKNIYDDILVTVIIDGLRWPEAHTYNSNFGDYLSDVYQGTHITTLETTEMEVLDTTAGDDGSTKGYCKEDITLPALWSTQFERVWAHSPTSYGIRQYCISVTITIEMSSETPQTFSLAKKMLEESIATDAVLVGGCGTEIKCHTSFLSAHSAELGNMFQNDFKESKTGRIELVDMSKEGIGAFLEYLYYWGTDQPEERSTTALELYEAAHKYNVAPLEKKMKQILLRKQNDWFDVNVALRLFLFARNVEGCENVKKKSIMVLKSKFSQLEDSEEYQNLFTKDPKAAMQLCAASFSV